MKRRAAIEPVLGHVKAWHRMGRNFLKGRDGNCANVLLAAAGYNFGLLRRLAEILRAFFAALLQMPRFAQISAPPGSSRTTLQTDRGRAPTGADAPRGSSGRCIEPVPQATRAAGELRQILAKCGESRSRSTALGGLETRQPSDAPTSPAWRRNGPLTSQRRDS